MLAATRQRRQHLRIVPVSGECRRRSCKSSGESFLSPANFASASPIACSIVFPAVVAPCGTLHRDIRLQIDMFVLGDDVLLGRIGVDLIDSARLSALFERGLLIGIADGDIARATRCH